MFKTLDLKKNRMKKYLIQYKPFLFFLTKFFLSYLALTLAYHFYLSSFGTHLVDGITKLVGQNTQQLLRLFAVDLELQEKNQDLSLYLIHKNQVFARLKEGCNAMSIIILFMAFVFSFTGTFSKTVLFVVLGVISIYIFNIIRISVLFFLMFTFPAYVNFLHQIVFPLVLYGFVFVLWVFWVTKFSIYAKKNLES